jgi:Domain of unknown function (DUF4919)
MRITFVSSGLLLIFLLCRAASAQDTPKQKLTYEDMVERVKGGDQTIDFRQLRLAYMDSRTYSNGASTGPQKKAMTVTLNSKDFHGAIKNADVVLTSNFVDMDAHFAEYIANRELNATDKSEFHKFVLQALLKSITDSGDGKTPETAFQVIQVHEEYVLLRFMGVGLPESQSLLQKNGHSYDEIKFKDPKSGESVILYFNVDIPAKHGL